MKFPSSRIDRQREGTNNNNNNNNTVARNFQQLQDDGEDDDSIKNTHSNSNSNSNNKNKIWKLNLLLCGNNNNSNNNNSKNDKNDNDGGDDETETRDDADYDHTTCSHHRVAVTRKADQTHKACQCPLSLCPLLASDHHRNYGMIPLSDGEYHGVQGPEKRQPKRDPNDNNNNNNNSNTIWNKEEKTKEQKGTNIDMNCSTTEGIAGSSSKNSASGGGGIGGGIGGGGELTIVYTTAQNPSDTDILKALGRQSPPPPSPTSTTGSKTGTIEERQCSLRALVLSEQERTTEIEMIRDPITEEYLNNGFENSKNMKQSNKSISVSSSPTSTPRNNNNNNRLFSNGIWNFKKKKPLVDSEDMEDHNKVVDGGDDDDDYSDHNRSIIHKGTNTSFPSIGKNSHEGNHGDDHVAWESYDVETLNGYFRSTSAAAMNSKSDNQSTSQAQGPNTSKAIEKQDGGDGDDDDDDGIPLSFYYDSHSNIKDDSLLSRIVPSQQFIVQPRGSFVDIIDNHNNDTFMSAAAAKQQAQSQLQYYGTSNGHNNNEPIIIMKTEKKTQGTQTHDADVNDDDDDKGGNEGIRGVTGAGEFTDTTEDDSLLTGSSGVRSIATIASTSPSWRRQQQQQLQQRKKVLQYQVQNHQQSSSTPPTSSRTNSSNESSNDTFSSPSSLSNSGVGDSPLSPKYSSLVSPLSNNNINNNNNKAPQTATSNINSALRVRWKPEESVTVILPSLSHKDEEKEKLVSVGANDVCSPERRDDGNNNFNTEKDEFQELVQWPSCESPDHYRPHQGPGNVSTVPNGKEEISSGNEHNAPSSVESSEDGVSSLQAPRVAQASRKFLLFDHQDDALFMHKPQPIRPVDVSDPQNHPVAVVKEILKGPQGPAVLCSTHLMDNHNNDISTENDNMTLLWPYSENHDLSNSVLDRRKKFEHAMAQAKKKAAAPSVSHEIAVSSTSARAPASESCSGNYPKHEQGIFNPHVDGCSQNDEKQPKNLSSKLTKRTTVVSPSCGMSVASTTSTRSTTTTTATAAARRKSAAAERVQSFWNQQIACRSRGKSLDHATLDGTESPSFEPGVTVVTRKSGSRGGGSDSIPMTRKSVNSPSRNSSVLSKIRALEQHMTGKSTDGQSYQIVDRV